MADVKWIKIVTDIFDDEKIRFIETMPNGDEIIVIWFRLLCLCGKANAGGFLMFTNKLAYTDEMLASIFNRDIKVIQMALKTFENLEMIEMIDNRIYIANWEKHQNIDGLEKIREQGRKRVAKHREMKKICNVTSNVTVTQCNAIDKDIDKEIELDKELDIKEENNESLKNDSINIDEEFNELWKLYPNKKGKPNALKSYKKARTRKKDSVDFETVKNGINAYNNYIKKSNVEQQYIKHGSTWFNQECWNDDYTIVNVPKKFVPKSDEKSLPEWYINQQNGVEEEFEKASDEEIAEMKKMLEDLYK